MADLTTKGRNRLASSTFGLPAERKYPMPDANHAANAKARAAQQVTKGNLSEGQKAQIDAKANAILAHHHPTHSHAHKQSHPATRHAHHASGK